MESLPLNRLDEDEAKTGQTVSRGRVPPVRTAIVLLLLGVASVAVFRPGLRPSNDGGPVSMVAHGTEIPPEQWHDRRDFTAFVSPHGAICTGTVSKNKVITAKHCVEDLTPSEVTVQVSSKLNVWQSVTNIVLHPDLDVAILTFDGHHTNKKKLVLDGVTPAVGEQIRLAGFGQTHTGGVGDLHTSGPLQRVSCNWHSGVICASSGPDSQKSSCGGDSGGPWFQFRDNQELVELVGVNAFGFDGNCGEHDKKTGLVSVSYIKDWILQHAPEFEFTDDISCVDSDKGALDIDGDGCDWYTKFDTDGNHCGHYDNDNFAANVMCCRCGGGSSTAPPDTVTVTDTVTSEPDNCKTIGTAGVGAGTPCVFPFTYAQKTYNTCTRDGHSELWCATETQDGNYVKGMWGDCSCS